jgi:TonB family protein
MMNQDRKSATESDRLSKSTSHHSAYTTRAQEEFRSGGWKRMLGAVLITICALIAFMIFGPREEDIKQRFEYYGVRGEMQIMNEVSIDDGRDLTAQVPQSLRIPPPPAKLEIEEDTPDPKGTDVMPEESDADPNRIDVNTKNPLEDSEVSENYQVEMALPMQSNPDYYALHTPIPDYPMGATELERRTPVIVVKVGLFVDPRGDVSEVMILASNGSRVYEEAALKAVQTWKFGWRVAPGAGRWLQFPFNFKSPYFTLGR